MVASPALADDADHADKAARWVIEHLRNGDREAALASLTGSAKAEANPDAVAQVARFLIDVGATVKVEQVNHGWVRSLTTDSRTDDFIYHVIGQSRAALVFVTVETRERLPLVSKFYCEPAPVDLRDRYPFTLSGMSWGHVLAITLLVVISGTMIVAFVAVWKAPLKRRWLWAPLALVSVGKLAIAWIPGKAVLETMTITPITVSLVGIGVSKNPIYQPWTITLAVPIGALWLLSRVRRAYATAAAEDGPPIAVLPDERPQHELSTTPGSGDHVTASAPPYDDDPDPPPQGSQGTLHDSDTPQTVEKQDPQS